jgi:hypothetical protein
MNRIFLLALSAVLISASMFGCAICEPTEQEEEKAEVHPGRTIQKVKVVNPNLKK